MITYRQYNSKYVFHQYGYLIDSESILLLVADCFKITRLGSPKCEHSGLNPYSEVEKFWLDVEIYFLLHTNIFCSLHLFIAAASKFIKTFISRRGRGCEYTFTSVYGPQLPSTFDPSQYLRKRAHKWAKNEAKALDSNKISTFNSKTNSYLRGHIDGQSNHWESNSPKFKSVNPLVSVLNSVLIFKWSADWRTVPSVKPKQFF